MHAFITIKRGHVAFLCGDHSGSHPAANADEVDAAVKYITEHLTRFGATSFETRDDREPVKVAALLTTLENAGQSAASTVAGLVDDLIASMRHDGYEDEDSAEVHDLIVSEMENLVGWANHLRNGLMRVSEGPQLYELVYDWLDDQQSYRFRSSKDLTGTYTSEFGPDDDLTKDNDFLRLLKVLGIDFFEPEKGERISIKRSTDEEPPLFA